MPIDFTRVGASQRAALIHPRDIFTGLPYKPWPRLRLEQGEVLEGWFNKRSRRDVVIKQNTGGGKTVAGLLIAQSSLNEGVGPAIYLTPDTFLPTQVVAEAERLGISVTTDINDVRFWSSESILIATFHKLINGRSAFGVVGSGRPIRRAGTVIVDDAHAALSIAEHQFAVTIPRESAAYERLTSLFADGLKQQSESAWRAIDSGVPSAPIPIPFWDWKARESEVLEILEPYGADAQNKWIFYAWPLLRQSISLASAAVTTTEIEIRPRCSPIELIPAFAQARRRIYLTATLADDSVLVTELGASAEDVVEPVTPARAADLGDRLILAPLALNPSLGEDAVRELVHQYSQGDREGTGAPNAAPVNVVVLVPSDARAARWREFADYTCHVTDMRPVIERMKGGEHLGLVVLVNKYDGVDLPDDACRLLVVDGVPFPLSPHEAREASALAGTDTFAARQVQKIEQGMGRGVRDAEDYCAVLLLGPDLAMTLSNPTYRDRYSPATRAQIDLSLDIGSQIERLGTSAIREVLNMFLARDGDWLRASSEAKANIQYDHDGHVSAVAVARRRAFDLARAGQPLEASRTITDALSGIGDAYQAGWYKEEAAAYMHAVDPDAAQAILRQARLANINVVLPRVVPPVQRLRATAEQARAASEFLVNKYSSGVELELGFTMMLADMAFDSSRVSAAEQAFSDLGEHLGFAAERPDKLYSTGPDALWSVSDDLRLLLELKTGVVRPDSRIIKDELDQLSGHVSWHAQHYGATTSSIPVLVHPDSTHRTDGTPPTGARILTPTGLDDMKQRVASFARAIATNEVWRNDTRVRELLSSHQLTGKQSLVQFTLPPTPAG
ncbi:MAG: hypothetical protein KDB08_04665 [Microthrixaceae bacterium]|nr:hypothetical protein [Microthrixaceae bacterium]